MRIGATEIILILFIVLLLFGAKKIPELARGLGKGLQEFKKGLKEIDPDEKQTADVTKSTEKEE